MDCLSPKPISAFMPAYTEHSSNGLPVLVIQAWGRG